MNIKNKRSINKSIIFIHYKGVFRRSSSQNILSLGKYEHVIGVALDPDQWLFIMANCCILQGFFLLVLKLSKSPNCSLKGSIIKDILATLDCKHL